MPNLLAGMLRPPAPFLPTFGAHAVNAVAPLNFPPAPPAPPLAGVQMAVPDADRYRRRPMPQGHGLAPSVLEFMRVAAAHGFYKDSLQAKPLTANGKQVGVSIKSPHGGGAISCWTTGNAQPPTENKVFKITLSGRDIPTKERILAVITPWTLPFGGALAVQHFALPSPAVLLAGGGGV